jgi:succinate CoA transferase
MTAEEAVTLIKNNDIISLSGFTATGCPKAVTRALAAKAEEQHSKGFFFKIGLYTGASTGESADGVLSRANSISFRTPYQSNIDSRNALNNYNMHYFDLHLSEFAQYLRYGFLPKPNYAILEVCDITKNGKIILTSAVGVSPTIARLADKVIIELNQYHPKKLIGVHDIYEPFDPPNRKEIPIYSVNDRIGVPYIQIDPEKIIGIIDTNLPNEISPFSLSNNLTKQIGKNVANFLRMEMTIGRIPLSFLPIQSGVGNIANAVLSAIGLNEEIPKFEIYTEVIQDAVIELMEMNRVRFASGCSLSLTTPMLNKVYDEWDFFKDKLLLRPQEISNNPEIVRRLGLISINTALEADIFGNINSTHVGGTKMMNGIGGSGDFCRNAYLSIFTMPSTAKDGRISTIVPMVSHVDHNEHSVKILITEHGVADLRGLSPVQRAKTIINNCVDDQYKDLLFKYLLLGQKGHTPHKISSALSFHDAISNGGDMKNVKL